MPRVGFEPTISAGERPKTYALDRAATGTGYSTNIPPIKIISRIYETQNLLSLKLFFLPGRTKDLSVPLYLTFQFPALAVVSTAPYQTQNIQ